MKLIYPISFKHLFYLNIVLLTYDFSLERIPMITQVAKIPMKKALSDIQIKLKTPSEDLCNIMIKEPRANGTHTKIINIKKHAQTAGRP